MHTIVVQPCLLGFALSGHDGAGPVLCPGIYEHFHEVLWFLLNYPREFVVVVK